MRNKLFNIILGCSILLINCNKEKEVKTAAIWGTVVSQYDDKPVEGVKVYIYNSKVSTSRFYSSKLIDSTITAKNGGYYKEFEYSNGEAFQLHITKSGYFTSADLILSGKNKEHLLYISPNRNYQIRIRNTTPINANDSIYWFNTFIINGDFRSIEPRWFIGNVDTLLNIPIVFFDDNWYFQYQYKDSTGSWNINSIKPFCEPLDTTKIILNF